MCDVIDSKRVFTIIFVFVLREINYTLLAHFRTHTKMYSFSIPFSTFHRYRFSSSKKKSAQLFTAQLEIAKSFSIFLVRTQSAVRINTLMPICKAKKKNQSYHKAMNGSISSHHIYFMPFYALLPILRARLKAEGAFNYTIFLCTEEKSICAQHTPIDGTIAKFSFEPFLSSLFFCSLLIKRITQT